jgi:hypothetical protein
LIGKEILPVGERVVLRKKIKNGDGKKDARINLQLFMFTGGGRGMNLRPPVYEPILHG